MKKVLLLLLTCLTIIVRSQTPSDVSTIYDKNIAPKYLNNFNPYDYSYCDADGDGFVNINLEDIIQTIISEVGLINLEEEAVFISTHTGNIIRINQPSTQPTIEYICTMSSLLSDIAIDKDENLFVNNYNTIYSVDSANCDQTPIYEFPSDNYINSLSYDTEGNLYFGFGNKSEVYRFNANDISTPYFWHDFEEGRAGGDFVMLNGKLYISWNINGDYRLYRVTVDNNFNYISHQDLGAILDHTFGLASEFGKLFGVTPTSLYQINLSNLTFTTIHENDNEFGQWWGAAGLHEAVNFIGTAYENYEDATNKINPLPSNYINTQANQQTIFITIENTESEEFSIIEVQIIIYDTPQTNVPINLHFCSVNNSLGVFNLMEVEEGLLINVNQNVIISYHKSYQNALDGVNEINKIYQSIGQQESIYVRVKSLDNPCVSIENFSIINEIGISLAPIVNESSMRTLTNCYIDTLEEGFFKLNEIYEEVVIDSYDDYTLRFYKSFSDAEQRINEVPQIYYSTIGQLEEIFVRVNSSENCYSISNFFINGNCVFESNDFSNIYFPKVFTPNEDSYNDRWAIKGISRALRQETIVHIYNRYGKLLYAYRPYNNNGWDGTFHGRLMPSNDYWFKVIIPNRKEFTGHFALKR